MVLVFYFNSLFFFLRSPRPPRRALHHTLWFCPDHPLDQRGPGTCSYHTLRHWGQTFRWVPRRYRDTSIQKITTIVRNLQTSPYASLLESLIKESGVKRQHLLPHSLCPWYFNGLLIEGLQLIRLASAFSCDWHTPAGLRGWWIVDDSRGEMCFPF